MSKRLARLNEQLRRELSELIRIEVRDPRVGLVTITGVDTARDLGSAKVYVRAFGGEDELAASLQGLEAAAPFLRTSLGRMLHVRKIPELRFRADRSQQHALRIEEVLSEVVIPEEGAEGDGDASGDGDSVAARERLREGSTGSPPTPDDSDGGAGSES